MTWFPVGSSSVELARILRLSCASGMTSVYSAFRLRAVDQDEGILRHVNNPEYGCLTALFDCHPSALFSTSDLRDGKAFGLNRFNKGGSEATLTRNVNLRRATRLGHGGGPEAGRIPGTESGGDGRSSADNYNFGESR